MKKYNEPTLLVSKFSAESIMTTSTGPIAGPDSELNAWVAENNAKQLEVDFAKIQDILVF